MHIHSNATATTYGELVQAYDHFNRSCFGGQLPGALFTLTRKRCTYGYFSSERFASRDRHRADEISLNPTYFALCPIQEVLQTVVHEMTHQWQHRFGKPSRGRYHDSQWADRMEQIGLMPSHTGKPGGRRTGDYMSDYPIPGGRFEQECAELLTENFRISWYDRFVHELPTAAALPLPLLSSLLEAECVAETDLLVSADLVLPSQLLDLQGPRLVPNSNRVKYTCSGGCRSNVWGKPGLRLACLECGHEFAAAAS